MQLRAENENVQYNNKLHEYTGRPLQEEKLFFSIERCIDTFEL